MTAAEHNYRDFSEDDIKAALSYIDNSGTRDEWVRIGMAIKSEFGHAGLKLFDDWSRGGKGYSANDTKDTWKSIKATGGVTIGTLIAEAVASGFKFNEADRKPISQAEIDARQAQRDREEAAAKAEIEQRRAQAAKSAATIWDAGVDIDGDEHAYLARKGVRSFGLRVGAYRNIRNSLLIPLRLIDGSLVSLQAIFENASPMMEGRDRDYLPGGQKRGAFYMIGDKPSGSEPVILVGEGYSTCASAHMATGYCAAVALDSGNLRTVATALRNTYPHSVIVMLADNDCWHEDATKPNAGITEARQAAQTASAMIAIPQFSDTSGKPTDFNDLHKIDGLDAVRAQIVAALPKKPDAANDNEPLIPLDAPINPFSYPHISDKQQPLNTVENLEHLLTQYGIKVSYNISRKYVEVAIPGRDYGDDLEANCTLAEINSICARNRMPKSDTQEYIKLVASQNRYNPVEDFIYSKPWDGISRFGDLCATLKTPEGYDASLAAMLLRRWLISAAAAALKPRGFWSKGVLVLQGAQSEGKTSWIKSLLPPELRRLLKVGATIDPSNKDSVSGVISHWLVELGELDGTFRKADIARLKGFISQDIDQLRRPYDRLESEYQRRTVFFASVNPKVFLVDETGNTRWWTIPVLAVNDKHGIDVQQLWAEAARYYVNGERWWLDREDEARLEATNNDHQEPNTIEELICSRFNWDAPQTTPMSSTDVLIQIGYDKPNNKQAKDAGTVLRKLTGGEPKRSNGRSLFMMPPSSRGPRRDGVDDDLRPF